MGLCLVLLLPGGFLFHPGFLFGFLFGFFPFFVLWRGTCDGRKDENEKVRE
jgi:hypothetical protein